MAPGIYLTVYLICLDSQISSSVQNAVLKIKLGARTRVQTVHPDADLDLVILETDQDKNLNLKNVDLMATGQSWAFGICGSAV